MDFFFNLLCWKYTINIRNKDKNWTIIYLNIGNIYFPHKLNILERRSISLNKMDSRISTSLETFPPFSISEEFFGQNVFKAFSFMFKVHLFSLQMMLGNLLELVRKV